MGFSILIMMVSSLFLKDLLYRLKFYVIPHSLIEYVNMGHTINILCYRKYFALRSFLSNKDILAVVYCTVQFPFKFSFTRY